MKDVIIDVREKDEFEAEHVEGSINIPLSQFSHLAPGILSNFKDRSITLMCVSGRRATMALTQARTFGFEFLNGISVYEGGIQNWKKTGNPVVQAKAGHLPILRQTHLAAGLMAFTGTLLGVLVNPYFLIIPGFVGAGLTFAGATGNCMLSLLIAKMPWNRSVPELKREVCLTGTGDSSCDLK